MTPYKGLFAIETNDTDDAYETDDTDDADETDGTNGTDDTKKKNLIKGELD